MKNSIVQEYLDSKGITNSAQAEELARYLKKLMLDENLNTEKFRFHDENVYGDDHTRGYIARIEEKRTGFVTKIQVHRKPPFFTRRKFPTSYWTPIFSVKLGSWLDSEAEIVRSASGIEVLGVFPTNTGNQ